MIPRSAAASFVASFVLFAFAIPAAPGAESPLVQMNEFQRMNSDRIVRLARGAEAVPSDAVGVILEGGEHTALPPAVAGRADLQLLIVRGGRLVVSDALIGQIAALPALRFLAFDAAALSGDLRSLGGLRNAKNLRLLRIAGAGLSSVPDELGELAGLEGLILSQNKLEAVPAALLRLKNLRLLGLANNHLRRFGGGAIAPAQLEVLDLAENDLREIKLTWPAGLRVLDLSRNKLTAVPAGLGRLAHVEHLRLHDNYLEQITAAELPAAAGLKLTAPVYTRIDLPTDRAVDVERIK